MRAERPVAWLASLVLLAAACVPPRGGWDRGALDPHRPALAVVSGHRLRDATPYPRPVDGSGGEVELVLCRWPDGSRVPVRLPEPMTVDERAVLHRAVSAWDEVLAEVALVVAGPEEPAAIRLFFTGDPEAGPESPTALTGADCRLGPAPRLVSARVGLFRQQLDLVGRPTPLSPVELLGAALHELGHALGFQGHAARGGSIMVREVEVVRRLARAVWEGEPLHAPGVAALYRVPGGLVVGRRHFDEEGRRAWGALSRLARRAGGGRALVPLARVGDRGARLDYRGPDGRRFHARLPGWPQDLRRGRDPRLVLGAVARLRLEEASD